LIINCLTRGGKIFLIIYCISLNHVVEITQISRPKPYCVNINFISAPLIKIVRCLFKFSIQSLFWSFF